MRTPTTPSSARASSDPATLAARRAAGTRKRTQAPPTRATGRSGSASTGHSRARPTVRARSGRRRAPRGRARRRAPRRGGRPARRRRAPLRPTHDLRVGRALARSPSASAAARAASTAAPICIGSSSLGQTCASATPNAGGSARQPVGHRQRVELATDRERVHRHLAARDELLDEARRRCATRRAPRATAVAELPGSSRTSTSPRWPCRSGALITQGYPTPRPQPRLLGRRADDVPRLRHARLGEPLALAELRGRKRRRLAGRSDAAARAVRRCGPRSPPASRSPARRSRRLARRVASRSSRGSSSAEMIARRSAKRKPGAAGSRSRGDHVEVTRARGVEQPELRRARRLGREDACASALRGFPATTPHSRGTTRRCARGPPRTTCAPASRAGARPCPSSRCGGRPARAARSTYAFSDDGLPSASSTASAISVTRRCRSRWPR